MEQWIFFSLFMMVLAVCGFWLGSWLDKPEQNDLIDSHFIVRVIKKSEENKKDKVS